MLQRQRCRNGLRRYLESNFSENAMSEDEDRLLSFTVKGQTIGANLQRAIAAGQVAHREDGKFVLVNARDRQPGMINLKGYILRRGDFAQPCVFLNKFMFRHVYGEGTVPFGCRHCFKVKVVTDNLRQMMAVKEIAASVSATSKSRVELSNPENQHLYGTYFYVLGHDRARALYKGLRAKIDEHGKLGSGIKMLIKRGCTNYEHKCGPSERYTFDPQQEEIERHFFARFASNVRLGMSKSFHDGMQMWEWVRIAFRIGDNTYKDFTDGKDLHAPS
jgi:hypothetical protein